MPFINAASRKRERSNSRPLWSWKSNKLPRLTEATAGYDGCASRKSMESTSTTQVQPQQRNLRAKLKRGSSHIKTLFGLGGRQNDHDDETTLTIEKYGSHHSFRSIQPSPETRAKPLKLTLKGAPQDFTGDLQSTVEANAPEMQCAGCASSLHRSQSVPGFTHRLGHRFQEVFAHPTVVRRSNLHSRPSVCSMQQLDDKVTVASSLTDASTPSSKTAGSTPPTSGSQTVSSSSILHHGSPSPNGAPLDVRIIDQDLEYHRLSPVPEVATVPSIVTVEATANAKIFFETHFNAIINGERPRSVRRRELEDRLESLGMPPEIRHRARKVWARQETERLRQERVLKTKTNDRKAPKGISIAGYEVVRILGKGSFGVVKLVKEAPVLPINSEDAQSQTLVTSAKSSLVDLTSLKATAREAFAPLSIRKRDISKTKKQVYAMKVIRKSEMIRNSQEGHLRAERDFLVASEGCLWIIPLVAAFQDNRHLYLVMDFCIGGDFLGLLIRKNTLSEDVTRWYIAEMILCVEEAHRLKWIHRDVKPDNFLIGADGHLKISDFGLAFDGEWAHDQQYFHKHRHGLIEKLGIEIEGDELDQEDALPTECASKIGQILGASKKLRECKLDSTQEEPLYDEPILDWRNRERRRKLARSVVGTSQYMAPEVIRGEMYDGRCDWWSVGVIMYECLYGYTPFACENRQDTKLRILKHKTTLDFPDQPPRGRDAVSYEAIDLILRILQEKEKRLCSRRYQLNDFTRKMTNGRTFKVHADKTSKDYTGHFVYADDGEDIKAHPFFRTTCWEEMRLRKPPFVPRVKSWEDTKYFDGDDIGSISDMSESSEAPDSTLVESNPTSQISHHQQEDQKIVPSNPTACPIISQARQRADGKIANPLIALPLVQQQMDGEVALAIEVLAITTEDTCKKAQKKKEKKRPRDKILRDAGCGKTALEMRKKGAFLGYGYRRAKGVDEAVKSALNDIQNC